MFKSTIAILGAFIGATNAIQISNVANQEPMKNHCVYANKVTGEDLHCSYPGNSAWVDHITAPKWISPEDMGYTKGWLVEIFEQEKSLGDWTNTDPTLGYNLAGLTPNDTKVVEDFNFTTVEKFKTELSVKTGEFFALRLNGTVGIEKAGMYYFSTTSDDGSRLWVDGNLVVDNWGLHGVKNVIGEVSLSQGYHKVQVQFFNNEHGAHLEMTQSGPFAGQPVTKIDIWHHTQLVTAPGTVVNEVEPANTTPPAITAPGVL